MDQGHPRIDRRTFIKGSAAALAGVAAGCTSPPGTRWQGSEQRRAAIVLHPDDEVTGAAPCLWAANELRNALISRGVDVVMVHDRSGPPANAFPVVCVRLWTPTDTKSTPED